MHDKTEVSTSQAPVLPRHYSNQELVDQDFTGHTIKSSTFESVDLRYSRFNKTNLEDSSFSNSNAQFCDFSESNLKNTQFHDCDLQHCDFSSAQNLNEFQFCGSNLAYAKLPENFTFSSLDYIGDGSKQIWTLYLTILLTSLYSLLAIGSTNDIDLLGNAKSIFFPMLQMSIATVGFYYVAPVLLMSLMGAFYYQLTVYWKTVRRLPAIFPDGSSVTIKTMPSLIDTVVESCSPILRASRTNNLSSLIKLELTLVALLSVIPITLFIYWVRYLPRQDYAGSYLHATLFAMSICLAWHTWLVLGKQMRERDLIRSSIKSFIWAAFVMLGLTLVMLEGPKIPFNLFYLNVSNLNLTQTPEEASEETNNRYSVMLDGRSLRYAQMNKVNMSRSSLQGADLRSASLIESDLSEMVLNHVEADYATLRHSDLKGSAIRQSFFNYANFYKADLEGADFSQSQLTHADFTNSRLGYTTLARTNLSQARLDRVMGGQSNFAMAVMKGTTFIRAHLPRSSFYLVDVDDAHFWKSDLSQTQWVLASLHSTDMTKADLSDADFSQAIIQGSNFEQADLTTVKFLSTKLSRVSFRESHLVNANFTGAQLNDVDFREANLEGVDFTNAWFDDVNLTGSDLKNTKGLTIEQLYNATYDHTTIFPDALKPVISSLKELKFWERK